MTCSLIRSLGLLHLSSRLKTFSLRLIKYLLDHLALCKKKIINKNQHQEKNGKAQKETA